MTVQVKICGLSTRPTLEAALAAGADMVGFVFFEKSPRHIGLDAARALGAAVAGRARKVALLVDADDAAVSAVVEALTPDILQLHGKESPERVAAIRARFDLPVMKALGIGGLEDLGALTAYEPVADWLLLDARPPKDAMLPGGNGIAFDWGLIAGLKLQRPWLLSGGLNPSNVGAALRLTGAPGVDVSSGIETAPGVKDEGLIRAFVMAAKQT